LLVGFTSKFSVEMDTYVPVEVRKEKFCEENAPMLDYLSGVGWDAPEDPAEVELMLACFEMFQTQLPAMRQAIEQTVQVKTSTWVNECAPWEMSMPKHARVSQRKDLLACAMQKMVDSDFLRDAQDRWVKAEFSSVSRDFLVIGDLWVRRQGGSLDLKMEYDPDLPNARAGRKDVTYQNWQCGKMLENVVACRPKINGERFVVEREQVAGRDQKILRGFKSLFVPQDFVPTLVEYYAGKYFVLEPYVSTPVVSEVWDGSKKKVETFLPNRWMDLQEAYQRRDTFLCHRFDGIMLQVKVGEKTEEYRAKWAPSIEVEVQGQVWEVSSVKKMHMVRPRYGKLPVSATVADATIRSRLQGEYLFPFFLEVPVPDKTILQVSSSVSVGQVVGVKAIIFHCAVGKPLQLVFIRDNGKPLDCLGGHLEVGETPVRAMIREGFEETSKAANPLQMDPRQLVYHGMTPSGNYASHVFSYLMMEDPSVYPGMEVVEMDDIPAWVNSQKGYPRQSWLARHLLYIAEDFSNLETALAAHLMAAK